MPSWVKQRVLITVRTYPVPAKSGVEVSCTAGVTVDGRWIRLSPVPYRFLEEDQRFKKYQWIDVETARPSSDTRLESFKLRAETIKVLGSVASDRHWQDRWAILRPLVGRSLCDLRRTNEPTLGLVKPAKISRLIIEPTEDTWTEVQLQRLNQQDLFLKSSLQRLEKVPFVFRYEFTCQEASCPGHSCMCTDWELGQAYRRWRRDYKDEWENAFRNRFENEMINKYDTHFYVGNLHQYPNSWIIVGLFYPPKPAASQQLAMNDLFG